MTNQLFPKDFLRGASTSAHQVEGGTHNQWEEWESANADRLAETAPERLSWLPNWQAIKRQATDPENYISGNGVEHYTRYREDFDLLKQLNMNAFRFSIEWSRLEPEEGKWDETAIEHYRQYIAELKKRHIEPIMTLWHWTVPVWFAEKGGFEKSANLHYFNRFVQKVAGEYGADVKQVITLNEPNVYTFISYISGEWPPQSKNIFTALKVYWRLVRAHRAAHAILKLTNPDLQVGVAMNMSNGQPSRPHNPLDIAMAGVANYVGNRWFLDRVRSQLDFVGVNYYNTDYYRGLAKSNPKTPVSDLGWYMEPSGLLPVLLDTYKHYKKPIIIAENGLADAHDAHRQWWIGKTLTVLEKAIEQGVDLRGYLHWSLLDNFEWADGWWPKFGLIEVDRTTMKRTPRPSARWLAEQIKNPNQN